MDYARTYEGIRREAKRLLKLLDRRAHKVRS